MVECGRPERVQLSGHLTKTIHVEVNSMAEMKSTKVPKICVICGRDFLAFQCYVKRGQMKCCSVECAKVYNRAKPAEKRFWSHVDKNGPVPAHRPELGHCWIWTASTNVHGYGQICPRSMPGKMVGTSRFSWEIHYGPISDGLWVLHHCDTPACIRPEHLFLGTQTDNMRDMISKGRAAWQKRAIDA
jgi:hypothetical protein